MEKPWLLLLNLMKRFSYCQLVAPSVAFFKNSNLKEVHFFVGWVCLRVRDEKFVFGRYVCVRV